MQTFTVTYVETMRVNLDSPDFPFAWIHNIRKNTGEALTSADIQVGDRIIFHSGLFYLQPKGIESLVEFSNILPQSHKYISTYYKYIRVFPQGHENFNFCLAYKIVEYSYIWKNIKILSKLYQYSTPYTRQLINYFIGDIERRNFSEACTEIYSLTAQLKHFGKEILNIFHSDLENCLEHLGISLKKVVYPYMTQIYINNSGDIEFVLYEMNNNFSILYRDDEIALINSQADIKLLQEFSKTQHNMENMIVDKKEEYKKIKEDNQNIHQVIFDEIKIKIENLDIGDHIYQAIEYLKNQGQSVNELEYSLRSKYCCICNYPHKVCYMLDCKHSYCFDCLYNIIYAATGGKVVLNDEEKKYSQVIYCGFLNCNWTVNENAIRNLMPNYDELKAQADARKSYRCSKCLKDLNVNYVLLSCRHLCNECVFSNMRSNNFDCSQCHSSISQEDIFKLISLKQTCEICNKSMNEYKGFPFKACNHKICIDCLLNYKGMCPIDQRMVQSQENIHRTAIKTCYLCSIPYRVSNSADIMKSCECSICDNCLLSEDEPNSLNCCRYCKSKYSQEAIKYINEKYIYCRICLRHSSIDYSTIIKPCDDKFCSECFKGNAESNKNNIEMLLKCPNCNVNISPGIYDEIFSQEITEKILIYRLEEQYDYMDCYYCHKKFPTINNSRKQRCNECEKNNCFDCKEGYHEDNSYDCKEKYIQDLVAKSEIGNDENGVSQCPGCRLPYTKDHKCDHVNCINRKCQMSFCFICAAPRIPILAHGNHYHRPDCKHYQNGIREYKDRCDYCKKLGKVCPTPSKLKVPRRISKDEVEEIKLDITLRI